ncbi:uncharacterized protein LOC132185267 [Corylus avellana]|uniref:uncharacterized protein LOC132185267 n=1 Tax=Corylus avellana TaxID=13451 RepID=UPI00286AEFA8|nr:uncharacterized protein LOC132185267 [Corylus avellana]
MGSNIVQQQIPRLSKDNYGSWSIQMRALFAFQDLWEVITDGFTEPSGEEEAEYTADENKTLKEQRKKDKKALFLLYQALDESTFEKVAEAMTSMGDFSFHLQMRQTGEMGSSPTITGRVRGSSHEGWRIVLAIEESKDLENLTIEELLGSLQVHEQRMRKNANSGVLEQALESKLTLNNQGKFSCYCGHGRGWERGIFQQPCQSQQETQSFRVQGQGGNRGRGRSTYGPGNSKNIQCYNCKKFGHYASDCWHKDDEQANVAEATNEVRNDSILLLAYDDLDSQYEIWYLDSGASIHMYGKKDLFVELTKGVHGNVNLGDSSKLSVEGNVLSIGQLLEKGFTIHMKNYSLILRDTLGGIVARVPMTNNHMFPLHLNIKSEKCFYGLKESESWKWHLLFGHLHFSGLKLLSSFGMVHWLPVLEPPSNVCEGCILGK